MPKSSLPSPSPLLPPITKLQSDLPRMSDVALRKKKNADAQAAFRARRANYIATLEETVTSLESVVLQLQESCRESRNESQELRQENARLRHENREREKFWKSLWHARKSGHAPDADDVPPSFSTGGMNGQLGTPQLQHQYGAEHIGYRAPDDSVLYGGPTPGHHFQPDQSPSLAYAAVTENEMANDGSINHRLAKYSPYPYPVPGPARVGRWQQQSMVPTGGDSGVPTSASSSHSPVYTESSALNTTDLGFVGRYSGDEQKLAVLDNAPYVFPNGEASTRSISPTTSTPGSTSSTTLTSSFQFTFPDNSSNTNVSNATTNAVDLSLTNQDRPEYDYRRHSLPHCTDFSLHPHVVPEMTLSSSDSTRYCLPARRIDSNPDRNAVLSATDNPSNQDLCGSDGDPTSFSQSRRSRRGGIPSRSSRSPSPGTPAISCTVAVIKAQAFGALRRTRARTKKTSEGAARVAMDVLEARGIGMGVSTGSKRPRLQEDDIDPE